MTRKNAASTPDTTKDRPPHLSQTIALAFLPALCLLLYWSFGETALLVAALCAPALLLGLRAVSILRRTAEVDHATGLLPQNVFFAKAQMVLDACEDPAIQSALFVLEIEDINVLTDRHGSAPAEMVMETAANRLVATMRSGDAMTRLSKNRFALCLHAVPKLNLETSLQLCHRLQTAVEEPMSIEGINIYTTASIGFCHNQRLDDATSENWLKAAELALREAQANGPAAIRAFSTDLRVRTNQVLNLKCEVASALENGQIKAWFQPQISTDTGLVSGFEALARWEHPQRGLIPPSEFLPVIEKAGLLERLADEMMIHAFRALKAWDNAGVVVPQVGVNFAGPELNNPKLVDKVMWNLDRFDLKPQRLSVEVLETVVASAPDDIVARNINGLSQVGCNIDLDDFGTGHASITSIRRFSVSRIKIDRSFVTRADRDPEQQRMISAILTMAERLDVETLAEGVETSGEHALLSQLGCDHVQGFGIARPMPFSETLPWMQAHSAKLKEAPKIFGNKSG